MKKKGFAVLAWDGEAWWVGHLDPVATTAEEAKRSFACASPISQIVEFEYEDDPSQG